MAGVKVIDNVSYIHTDDNSELRLKKWRSGVASVKTGVRDSRVLIIGDSTTIGMNGSGVMANPQEYQQLGFSLTRNGINAEENSFFGFSGSGTGDRLDADDRISKGAWEQNLRTLGGFLAFSGTSGDTLTFTPRNDCDMFRVFFTAYGGSSTVDITATGGSTVSASTAGGGVSVDFAGNVRYVDVSAASLGANTLTIEKTNSTSGFYIAGIEAWDSTKKQVKLMNAGWWGSRSTDWIDTGQLYSSLTVLDDIPANYFDLIIIKSGINDQGLSSKSSFKANIQLIIDAALSSGSDVLLETDNPESSGFDKDSDLVVALRELADENELVFIDQTVRFDSYSTANNLGFMSDTVHPNEAGYCDMAGKLSKILLRASSD